MASYVNNNVPSELIQCTEELSSSGPPFPAPMTGQIGQNIIYRVSSPEEKSAMNFPFDSALLWLLC